MNIEELVTDSGWVTADGTYGVGGIVVFNPDKLSDEQWETLDSLGDNDRYDYVIAILNGDDLSEWKDN